MIEEVSDAIPEPTTQKALWEITINGFSAAGASL